MMRALGRWLLLLALAGVGLQLFFALRILGMNWLARVHQFPALAGLANPQTARAVAVATGVRSAQGHVHQSAACRDRFGGRGLYPTQWHLVAVS